MDIREIQHSDAEKLADLMQQVDESSQYMLWEAGERKITTEGSQKMITGILESRNSNLFVAEDNGKLMGYLLAIGGNAKRNKHAAYLVIGIHSECRGKGVGTLLFNEVERWAMDQNVHRLELTVVTQNEAGLSLYRKMGFEIEGTKRDSLLIDDKYVDEYYMSKLL
ncbi:Protein N-acetyltransferase, RimJ/RimL family [Oceanobacillus limi]|uniref:Protein N-acetyltransferase, RimJ/RimL family n=1 Tax=Oceanobacillus limi TaxID=930131 RepID=A0A1H9YF76_9BACI|nr:GNAT family N-acetyltransferase [Oceanobacillus limi]SES67598.1 Protein N-acetyltransferase, RimJ/RimL family [Oceanobacillus limi]